MRASTAALFSGETHRNTLQLCKCKRACGYWIHSLKNKPSLSEKFNSRNIFWANVQALGKIYMLVFSHSHYLPLKNRFKTQRPALKIVAAGRGQAHPLNTHFGSLQHFRDYSSCRIKHCTFILIRIFHDSCKYMYIIKLKVLVK